MNFNKHIHTGEGGVCVTNNKLLDYKMRLIRNHGEACLTNTSLKNLTNNIGFNFRLTEIQAAIGIEQLKKINKIISITVKASKYLIKKLKNLKYIKLPIIKNGCSHVLYFSYLVGSKCKFR